MTESIPDRDADKAILNKSRIQSGINYSKRFS